MTTAQPAPRVPPGTRLYAIGDIHGRDDLLARVHGAIERDLGGPAGAPDSAIVVYLGDYVDRGPDSKGVIARLIAGPPAGARAVALKGNHEDLMLRVLAGEGFETLILWLRNGGLSTLESYGVVVGDPFASSFSPDDVVADLAREMPESHLRFLRGLSLSHRAGDYFFAHAGVRPGVALDRQSAEDLMWIRRPFLDATEPLGAIVVHGHTIRPQPEITPTRIGIDTGAFLSGRLTCLVLEGDGRRFLAA